MRKITSCFSMSRLILMSFILLFSLFISETAFCRQTWNGDFMTVTYNPTENSIKFKFEVFDYHFGPGNENGYLRWCDFYFTTDDVNYDHLMRAETHDQGTASWTWLIMRYKRPGAELQFLGCTRPNSGAMWPDNREITVDVNNAPVWYKAFFTVKWFLGKTYKHVKRIRLNGHWNVNGLYEGDKIDNVYYDIPSSAMLKSNKLKDIPLTMQSEVNTPGSKNGAVKVSKEADALVVNGAVIGENIKVYSFSGSEVKSVVAQNDIVNIKLAKNQIYVVKIGQASYKVAL